MLKIEHLKHAFSALRYIGTVDSNLNQNHIFFIKINARKWDTVVASSESRNKLHYDVKWIHTDKCDGLQIVPKVQILIENYLIEKICNNFLHWGAALLQNLRDKGHIFSFSYNSGISIWMMQSDKYRDILI